MSAHEASTETVKHLSSDRIFWEWMRGCSNTFIFGHPPYKCRECTEAMMRALSRAMEREQEAEGATR